jgi:hypothetical protein
MFVIGTSTASVRNGKLVLPPAYHLKRKRILGKWKDKNTLYLSDSSKSLKYAAGSTTQEFEIDVDTEDRISLPVGYESANVEIVGCITTIELKFKL